MPGEHGLDSRMLSTGEVSHMLQTDHQPFKGALFTPSDYRAEPQRAVPAIARRAKALGARIHERCAVRGLEHSGGRVSAVITERARCAARPWCWRAKCLVAADAPSRPASAAAGRESLRDAFERGTAHYQSGVSCERAAFRRQLRRRLYHCAQRISARLKSPGAIRDMWLYRHVIRTDLPSLKLRIGTKFLRDFFGRVDWRP
ncbi:MAG: FAD-dependent oxidoreductase [Geminicoccaceae bacterium]